MRTAWQIAIESKDDKKIREVLANGYIPENLQELITVEISPGNERSVSIVEILLWSDRTIFLEIADKFIGLGASLPPQRKNRSDFPVGSEYLQHLANSQHDLFIALRTDPNLMNLRGADQETLFVKYV